MHRNRDITQIHSGGNKFGIKWSGKDLIWMGISYVNNKQPKRMAPWTIASSKDSIPKNDNSHSKWMKKIFKNSHILLFYFFEAQNRWEIAISLENESNVPYLYIGNESFRRQKIKRKKMLILNTTEKKFVHSASESNRGSNMQLSVAWKMKIVSHTNIYKKHYYSLVSMEAIHFESVIA